jgi:dihydropteroate synthase
LEAEDTLFYKKSTLNAHGKICSLATPVVMGIINITPDSFYEGSRNATVAGALQQAGKMLAEGAAILDVGGYSSRPGAAHISEAEEMDRVLPVIKAIATTFPGCLISADTFRAGVAEAAINEGAGIINDISGGEQDKNMFGTAGKLKVPYILMHMRGTPQTMNRLTGYDDIMQELAAYFEPRVAALQAAGVNDIILDPGFGFAKTVEQNYIILRRLAELQLFGLPVLAGMSRKSMTYKPLNIAATEALAGTIALNTLALTKGAAILRVHDVKEAVQTIQLVSKTINA